MARAAALPSAGALAEVRRLAGPAAVVVDVARLDGGQHADTWRVDTGNPASSVIVRQFSLADTGARDEHRALVTLDGLGGLAPLLLGSDLDGRWSKHPTTLISRLDGEADITPGEPEAWARELGRALARVHAAAGERLSRLPSVLDARGSPAELEGPLAATVRARWTEVLSSPARLTHSDYWSGNVVWRDGRLTGIVDWSGAARGPRGYDVGWCRLDLVLLHDEHLADFLLAAYEAGCGETLGDVDLWDAWAAARSHEHVVTWAANYAPLGRPDLDERELRERHARWSARLLERSQSHLSA